MIVNSLRFVLVSCLFVFSLQLVINEIDESAATPLQAVKLLALYLASPANKVKFWFQFIAFLYCLLLFVILKVPLSDVVDLIENRFLNTKDFFLFCFFGVGVGVLTQVHPFVYSICCWNSNFRKFTSSDMRAPIYWYTWRREKFSVLYSPWSKKMNHLYVTIKF